MDKRIALMALVLAATGACSRKAPTPAASPSTSPSPASTAALIKPVPNPLPAVVAEVNGQPVSGGFLQVIVTSQTQGQQVPPTQKDAMYRSTLDSLIARELLFQEATARGIKADDAAVRQAYDQPRSRFATEQQWKEHLATQGFTPETYRTEIRIQRTVAALLKQEVGKVSVSDADVRGYYDSHPSEFDVPERLDASHILVMVGPQADAATRTRLQDKAKGILARARKGEDFAKLARENSDDPGSAKAGGHLPPFPRGQMVKPFEEAAFALKPGEISGVVETPFGYHIIKLHKRLAPEHLTFDAVHDRLRAYLVHEKQEATAQQLVARLKAKAKIDIKI